MKLNEAISSSLTQINKVEYADGIFETHITNTPLDGLFSVDGGVPKATNWMIVGDPGVGKSTVTLDIIANAKATGSKVLFISAEMNQVDLYLYVQRYPKFGDLDIFFPQELEDDENPKQVLEDILSQGWDIVLIDSLIELQDIIREEGGMTSRSAEKWLLSLMYKHNMGDNEGEHHTTFLNIQQVNKGGTFVGSNKLKHMTTGMMEIRFVDPDTQEERYVVFSKNRRGHVGRPMYFDLSTQGDVVYDTERFKKSESLRELKKKEKEMIKNESLKFDELFGIGQETDTEVEQSTIEGE